MDMEHRKDARLAVQWQGYLEDALGTKAPCSVLDVSEAGALITTDLDVPMGAELILVIEGLGDFASKVQWQGDSGVGLMLLAGDNLALKKFAEGAGAKLSDHPMEPQDLAS